jgi:hypothetical protein
MLDAVQREQVARAAGIGAVVAFLFAAFTTDSLALRLAVVLLALGIIGLIVWQAMPLW